jgi:short-subunit dehydrogenase involved in D-alanine esterification of teichoic acids
MSTPGDCHVLERQALFRDVTTTLITGANRGISPSEATVDHMRTVYETNVFGPVRLLRAFIPLLENSLAPVVVNVSSGVGSQSRV